MTAKDRSSAAGDGVAARGIPRRVLLRVAGAAGVAVGLAALPRAPELRPEPAVEDLVSMPTETLTLLRAEDQLLLRLTLVNARVQDGQVVRSASTAPALLLVHFSPQSSRERSYAEGTETPPAAPVPLRLSGESMLAFDLTGHLPLPCTTAELLDWARFPPVLMPNALGRHPGPHTAGLRPPNGFETALEVPYGMVVSPDGTGGWRHRTTPTVRDGWTELWHTRLGRRIEQNGAWKVVGLGSAGPVLRGLWGTHSDFSAWLNDPGAARDNPAYPLSDRKVLDIVRMSGDFSLRTTGSRLPAPIEVDELMLSGLGATLAVHGGWEPQTAGYAGSLDEWAHRMTMGRDQEVRTVRRGFLMPFGHKAAFVTVSERRFERANGVGRRGAYLRTRRFLVLLEPERSYVDDPSVPAGGRQLPFRRVRAVTRVTPDLSTPTRYVPLSADPAAAADPDGAPAAIAFLAHAGGRPLSLDFVGTDWAGEPVDFTVPVVFLSEAAARKPALLAQVRTTFNAAAKLADPAAERVAAVRNRQVALAPSAKPGDTALPVKRVSFALETPLGAITAGVDVPFHPVAAQLVAELPPEIAAVAKQVGEATFEYYTEYAKHGFEKFRNEAEEEVENLAGVFLQKAQGTTGKALEFLSENTGGLVTPNLIIDGFSRGFGPVAGDLWQAALKKFDPKTIFTLVGARLLGGVRLTDVLREVAGIQDQARQAIQLVTEEIHKVKQLADLDDEAMNLVKQVERVQTTMRWRPELKAGPGSLQMFVPRDGANALQVDAVSVAQLIPPAPPTYDVRGELRDVDIHVWGTATATHFISVHVKALRFTAASGQKPDVHCDLGEVTFHGALRYLADLAKLCRLSVPALPQLPGARRGSARALAATPAAPGVPLANGGYGPLSVEVTTQQIKAELSMALPSLQLGVFGLNNLRLFAGVYLPFDGSAVRFRFSVNSRADPFNLKLSFFGGGGFFALAAGAEGVESLEVSLEASAGTTFSIAGLVSGGVEMKIGVYFGIKTLAGSGEADSKQSCELSGYLRLNGHVRVLGLVGMSLDCYLALTYVSDPDRLIGEATVTLTVDLMFFQQPVSFTVKRELMGGGGTPAAAARSRTARGAGAPAALTAQPLTLDSHFGDVYAQTHWDTYCDAFAPVGA